jgi:hypothetical protein
MAKKHKDPMIAAAHVAPADFTGASTAEKPARELPEPRDMNEYLGLSAEVAGSTTCSRNARWPEARDDFPHDPLLRTCDKHFAFAVGGALFIDEPKTRRDLESCLKKAPKLREHGHRYVYIDRTRTDEPTPDQVLAQLEAA